MRIGSLFTGYGGLDMAVEQVFGATTAWVSDIDKGACKILAHRYPDVPNLGDITAIDWATVEPVDIITGGSPCQDLSHAGRRAGMTEGTRSNLWVAMREAIAQLKPSIVVWENVRGAFSAKADSDLGWQEGLLDGRSEEEKPAKEKDHTLRALGRVLGDLSDLGYDTQWYGLRAADISAPHGRFRVFVVACLADTPRPQVPIAKMKAAHGNGHGKSLAIKGQRLLPTPRATNNENRQSERYGGGKDGNFHELMVNPSRFSEYAAVIQQWENVLGRPMPEPTQLSRNGNPQLSPRFFEWLMGLPDGWVTEVHGITRNEALKACGNGVVPQQAVRAINYLMAVAIA